MGACIQGFRALAHSNLLLFLLVVPIAAQAQEAAGEAVTDQVPPPAPTPEEIVVVGSRIPRLELTAISPVTMISGEEVHRSGAILTEQLINALPQVVPNQGAFLSNGATGAATVDLRGLGPSRTLVLINGRRLLPGDPFDPVPDINMVPSALIKRVEVLTGGASSVYGSDAIAGAVNFVLDTHLNGLRVDGQVSAFQHDNRDGSDLRQALIRRGFEHPEGDVVDGESYDINAAYGVNFAGGRGNGTVYAGYRKLTAVTQDARDYSACAASGRFNSNIFDCGGSVVSAPGTFFTLFDLPYQVLSGRQFDIGITRYNFAPFNYYQRPGRRITAGAIASYDISAAARPFVEFMYMDDRTTAQVAPSGTFGEIEDINCDSPLLSAQQRDLICFNGNFVGQFPEFDNDGNFLGIVGQPETFFDPVTGVEYRRGHLFPARRNVEGGPRSVELSHKSLRLLGGIDGTISTGVRYEASLLYARVKFRSANANDFSISRTRRALDVIVDPATGDPACRARLTGEDPECVPWDIFAAGAVTGDALRYLTIAPEQDGSVKQLAAIAYSNIDLGEWGIGSKWSNDSPVVSFGVEYRKDRLTFEPDEFYKTGDIAGGDMGISAVRGTTGVKELFAETRIPLISDRAIDSLVVEAGFRHSWQANSVNKFSVNSYKLGLEFAPAKSIRFRGSLQRAVRAPNAQELFSPISPGGFGYDPCTTAVPEATAGECARTGVTADQYGHIPASPNLDILPYNSIGGGNPALDPEVATTKSVGVVLRPDFIPRLSVTIDWFDISLKGAIEGAGPTRIMRTCLETGDPVFCALIHRDSNGSLWLSPEGFVDSRLSNIGSLQTRGIDLGIYYTRPIPRAGSVDLEFLGSRLGRLTSKAGGTAPIECSGAYGLACGVPKPNWRHKARVSWNLEPVSLSLQWRYIGSVRLDRSTPNFLNIVGPWRPGDERIGAQSYFDFSAIAPVLRKHKISLGVRNLLDREPPIFSASVSQPVGACSDPYCNGNTFPQLYDPLGRYLFLGVTLNF